MSLLTNYLYVWTRSDSSSVKERTEQMTLETCRSSVWSQCQCHFFSQCYCCHPCFLLYYSISEWYQVFYVVWIYVCKEEMWESVPEDALFLLWNILCLLFIQAGIMFVSFLVECLYLIQSEMMQKCKWGRKRWRRKKGGIQQSIFHTFTVMRGRFALHRGSQMTECKSD